jgi:DNA gyrase subunit A
MSTSARNGRLVGAVQVFDGDELMLISNQGTLVRTRTDEVSILGRNTQGVRVIRTKEGESLVGVARIDEPAPEADLFEAAADTAGDTGVESAEPDAIDAPADNDTGDDGSD